MNRVIQPSGVVVPLITAFKTEKGKNRIDEESQRKAVRNVLFEAVYAVFVNSTTGENKYLTIDERLLSAQIAAEEAARLRENVDVYVGITAGTEKATIETLFEVNMLAERLKIDAVVAAPLAYHSNNGLYEHIQGLCDCTNLPIILYDYHFLARQNLRQKNIDLAEFENISRLEQVVALKYSPGEFARLAELINVAGNNCNILTGDETRIIEARLVGVLGEVPSIANLYAREVVQLDMLCNNNQAESDEAFALQNFIRNAGKVIYCSYTKNRWGLKVAMKEAGIIEHAITIEPGKEGSREEYDSIARFVGKHPPSASI